ncbi:dTDP-4-dehydrorhamnose 3,5-epimerase [Lentisphaerota bacterium ZTH]|nr:dTDP-4-dehydrorhamnose 3,5-epimerase [Lentisphaerota bacterium]WET05686.1 dTDP-4-dehydrorhamnose 3,5-epimerase [Lentisphaerota bacterium ZTH]
MNIIPGKLEGILVIEPQVFADNRGFFYESYNRRELEKYGIALDFVQDNHSRSVKNTLRGLHYQVNPGQDKLVRATLGSVWDVVLDIRKKSPTFGQWEAYELSAENKRQLFVPKGFAHGFCVLSDLADFQYKCSEYWSPEDERGIAWDDPAIGVNWPVAQPILSEKDLKNPTLKNADLCF